MDIFFIIIAIIGGLVGVFKDNFNKKTDNKPFQVPRPTATPSGGDYGDYQSQRQTPTVQTNANTVEIEDQREKQMQHLAERMNTHSKQTVDKQPHNAIIGDPIKDESRNYGSDEKAKMKKQVKNSLKGKRLVDGIILAEVLGPPRAIKPYRSVIANRKN